MDRSYHAFLVKLFASVIGFKLQICCRGIEVLSSNVEI